MQALGAYLQEHVQKGFLSAADMAAVESRVTVGNTLSVAVEGAHLVVEVTDHQREPMNP